MAYQKIISLSNAEASFLTELAAKGEDIFSTGDAYRILGPGKPTRDTLERLVEKGWLERIERGKYLIVPLEDADYEGHSLRMLRRIAKALDARVERPAGRRLTAAIAASLTRVRGIPKLYGVLPYTLLGEERHGTGQPSGEGSKRGQDGFPAVAYP